MADIVNSLSAALIAQGVLGIVLILIVFTGHLEPRRTSEIWKGLYEQERQLNDRLRDALNKQRKRSDLATDEMKAATERWAEWEAALSRMLALVDAMAQRERERGESV